MLAHGRALLAENRNTTVITADFRHSQKVLAHPDLRALIDLDQPVGLILFGVVHHINDDEDPAGIIRRYRDALAAGSYLFLTHFVAHGEQTTELEKMLLADLGTGRFRTLAEIGLVYNPLWRPQEPVPEPLTLTEKLVAGGLARKA
nr:SAM-dependent methyltransferase [Frankia gtarii]